MNIMDMIGVPVASQADDCGLIESLNARTCIHFTPKKPCRMFQIVDSIACESFLTNMLWAHQEPPWHGGSPLIARAPSAEVCGSVYQKTPEFRQCMNRRIS